MRAEVAAGLVRTSRGDMVGLQLEPYLVHSRSAG